MIIDTQYNNSIAKLLELNIYNELWDSSINQLLGNKQAFKTAGNIYSQLKKISVKHEILDEMQKRFEDVDSNDIERKQ